MSVTREEKLEQLERILQGRTLHGAESLRAFLRFVVTREIEGQDAQLKEYVIATEVFGRGTDYDSRVDSTVRVQAGRLRTKLQDYYAHEGRFDRVVIDLPKGQYLPVFFYSSSAETAAENGAEKNPVERHPYHAERREAAPLWDALLTPPEPTLVVFSTTIFHGSYEQGMRLYNSLNVLRHDPDMPVIPHAVAGNGSSELPMIDHYTGVGEAMGVHFLGDFFARMHHPYRLKRSLMLTWDDVKADNIVVLGSPAENLFLLELPQQQDFVFRWITDEHGRQVNAILNTNPQPGEQEFFVARQYGSSPSQISEDYAVISVLKGLSEQNRLMILAGINTFGTQAATEYVTQPEYIRELIAHLNIAAADEAPALPPFYQVLIRVKVSGGVPIQISYVTHHVL